MIFASFSIAQANLALPSLIAKIQGYFLNSFLINLSSILNWWIISELP